MFINRIRMVCCVFSFVFFFRWGTHHKAAYRISFLGRARHKPLILWKSTAVIGWPRGSQVITLTVDSVAAGGRRGRRRIKTTNWNVTKKGRKNQRRPETCSPFFPDAAARRGAASVLGTKATSVWCNCIFIWDFSGTLALHSLRSSLPFPIKMGNIKVPLPLRTPNVKGKNGLLGLFLRFSFSPLILQSSQIVISCKPIWLCL